MRMLLAAAVGLALGAGVAVVMSARVNIRSVPDATADLADAAVEAATAPAPPPPPPPTPASEVPDA